MSDSDFVDVGDELVVRIAGYPVGWAEVFKITSDAVWVAMPIPNQQEIVFTLPLDFKDYDVTDGVAHELSPDTGETPCMKHRNGKSCELTGTHEKHRDSYGNEWLDNWENEGGR